MRAGFPKENPVARREADCDSYIFSVLKKKNKIL